MKVQYRSVAGQLISEEWCDSCECCCFDFIEMSCIPFSVLDCNGTIFKETENDIFEV